MEYPTRARQWTRAEYDRLIDVGVFRPGEPIELLGGDLVVAEPQSSPRYTAISAPWLGDAFQPRRDVDAIAVDAGVVVDDVAQIEADTEQHAAGLGDTGVARGH